MKMNTNKLNKLMTMTDKQIQEWLRKISAEIEINALPIALLGVNDDVKNCIFRNMSVHAKTAVNRYIQELSRNDVKESEIQKNIIKLENLIY